MMDFKTGEVVQLNSGGPEMTIKGIIGDTKSPLNKMETTAWKMAAHEEGEVYCQWFYNNKIESAVFKQEMLKKI